MVKWGYFNDTYMQVQWRADYEQLLICWLLSEACMKENPGAEMEWAIASAQFWKKHLAYDKTWEEEESLSLECLSSWDWACNDCMIYKREAKNSVT